MHAKQNERGTRIRVGCRVSSRHATWIDEVFAIVLRDVMLVRVSTHEDVTVELSLNGSQSFVVAPWDNLMTVNDTNLEVVDLNDLCLREAWYIITVTSHNMRLAFRSC